MLTEVGAELGTRRYNIYHNLNRKHSDSFKSFGNGNIISA